MLNGEIFRQCLKIANAHVVADTIDYLEANFSFLSNDWDGLDKWAHFAKDSAVYDIRLTEDCIRKEDHLNLSAGMWKVYLHGNEFRDGKVIQRITTDEAVLYVLPTGTLDGEPFPEIPASETERINARLDELEKGGIGKPGEPGADGFSPSASVEQTDDGAVITLTDKDGTTTATITNGKDGQPGEKGDPGNDYVLTDEDKQEIAGMIPGGGSGGSAGVVIFSVLYTDEQAVLADASVVYPEGADMDTLLAAGQAQMVMLTPSDSGDVLTKLGVLLPTGVDVGGHTITFAGTITGKDGNEAVVAELHTGTGEITVTPKVQNSAGSGSSGGGGVVTITANDDGTYSSSHTPAEIAAMAQTGAVVALVPMGDDYLFLPLVGWQGTTAMFLYTASAGAGGGIETMMVIVSNDGVVVDTESSVTPMVGADADNHGTGGTVPAPSAGQQDAVLHGDGTWRAALSEEDKTDLVHRVIEKLPTWEGGTY